MEVLYTIKKFFFFLIIIFYRRLKTKKIFLIWLKKMEKNIVLKK